ncbi:hypothetical protein M2405_006343 [Rhodococcus erythropolis]|nr:hypothetical protein [Rhodococcus erythropolis]MCW2425190.1 hypothetical protein [Rhodococcus erythropolis]
MITLRPHVDPRIDQAVATYSLTSPTLPEGELRVQLPTRLELASVTENSNVKLPYNQKSTCPPTDIRTYREVIPRN